MAVETDRIISQRPASPQEGEIERALRPATLAEYVGQEKVRGQLEIFIQAARARSEALDHVLLFGPPGLRHDPPPPHIPRRAGGARRSPARFPGPPGGGDAPPPRTLPRGRGGDPRPRVGAGWGGVFGGSP